MKAGFPFDPEANRTHQANLTSLTQGPILQEALKLPEPAAVWEEHSKVLENSREAQYP